MASIVIVGGGISALTTAMLLADDGHEVTVLERDPDGPTDAGASWESWERRGVSQFRLPHRRLRRATRINRLRLSRTTRNKRLFENRPARQSGAICFRAAFLIGRRFSKAGLA